MTADDLLALFEVPTRPGVFVLGCLARRITIRDQQVRALNLVDALVAAGRLDRDDYVTVVGAGFGGLTVAAAAATVGARVRVVDDRAQCLDLQRGCDHRLLHPNINDWPADSSVEVDAGVLFLSWKASSADKIVDPLEAKWKRIVKEHSVQESYSTIVTDVCAAGEGKWTLKTLVPPPEIAAEKNRIVILAVGFGLENQQGVRPIIRYWDRDNLHRVPPEVDGTVRYLIAGSGDGALIDTLRARLLDFRHKTVLKDLKLTSSALAETRRKIRHIEETARERVDSADYLKTEYERLRGTEDVDAALTRQADKRVHVVLATRSAHFHSLQSTPLNRFLVSRLVALHLVEHQSGELVNVVGDRPAVTATLKPPLAQPVFYEVFTRVGPASALARRLDPIRALCDPKLRPRDPDLTRVPGIWSNLRSKGPMPAPLAPAAAPRTTDCLLCNVARRGRAHHEITARAPRPRGLGPRASQDPRERGVRVLLLPGTGARCDQRKAPVP